MRGLTLAAATKLKADMIPAGVLNAAQHQRDIAMNYYAAATEKQDFAESQTKHSRYLLHLAEAMVVFAKYRKHINIADRLVRT